MPPANANFPAVLLLAAGPDERMRSRRPKALHHALGKALARHVIDLCRRVDLERVVVLAGTDAEALRAGLGEDVEYVAGPAESGGLLLAAEPLLAGHSGPLLVLRADHVLLTDAQLQALLQSHRSSGASASVLTAPLFSGYAGPSVTRNADGEVAALTTDARPPEVGGEADAGVYLFAPDILFPCLHALAAAQPAAEVTLPEVIQSLLRDGWPVAAVAAGDPDAARTVNDRVELAEALGVLRQRVLLEHMRNGVTIEDPASTYIEADVRIGMDSVIRPNTWLSGHTVIGEECEIGPNARIADCTLGDRVVVHASVLASSKVGDETKIGPFAQLRAGCKIGRKVKLGNFVELKAAEVEDRVSVGHLAYIGDAFLGEKTNIGAGTITCNYDGKRKHRTKVGRGAFIGSHSTLVAPVEVADGGYTAAGSVITQDVPADALGIGRSRQMNKEGWARKNRERLEQGG